jgi:hypothetical protein
MSDLQPNQRYVLSDIDIPFFRLIVIFVKWSLAAIPAAIILTLILTLVFGLLGTIFGPSFMHMRGGPGI